MGRGILATVLTSWKEIAHYLGKSVRTVQRWERELGLPVRRPQRSKHGVVIALVADLDAWLQLARLGGSENFQSEIAALREQVRTLQEDLDILQTSD